MKRIVILGAAESGAGAAVLAKKQGFDVFVSDMSVIKNKYKELLDSHDIAWEEGKHSEDLILNGYSTQTLFFSAQDIRESEKDGPYTIKNIRITDRQTGDLIDACAVTGAKTVDLSATDFKSNLTVEEGAIRVTPVSAGSGVYFGLKLAVPVDAPSAGYVTLSAYVDDNEGHSVGRFENEFEVQSGYNKLELVMDGAKFREAGLNGPYTIKSIEVKHSASPENPYIAECTLETDNYKYTQFIGQGESLWQIGFNESQSAVDEVSNVVVRVVGGCGDSASSVKMYLSYQTAAAADLDLARGAVDGVAPKGGLKFPLTLRHWRHGDRFHHGAGGSAAEPIAHVLGDGHHVVAAQNIIGGHAEILRKAHYNEAGQGDSARLILADGGLLYAEYLPKLILCDPPCATQLLQTVHHLHPRHFYRYYCILFGNISQAFEIIYF